MIPKQEMQIICLKKYSITTAARIKQCDKKDINRKVFHQSLQPLSIKKAVKQKQSPCTMIYYFPITHSVEISKAEYIVVL